MDHFCVNGQILINFFWDFEKTKNVLEWPLLFRNPWNFYTTLRTGQKTFSRKKKLEIPKNRKPEMGKSKNKKTGNTATLGEGRIWNRAQKNANHQIIKFRFTKNLKKFVGSSTIFSIFSPLVFLLNLKIEFWALKSPKMVQNWLISGQKVLKFWENFSEGSNNILYFFKTKFPGPYFRFRKKIAQP